MKERKPRNQTDKEKQSQKGQTAIQIKSIGSDMTCVMLVTINQGWHHD